MSEIAVELLREVDEQSVCDLRDVYEGLRDSLKDPVMQESDLKKAMENGFVVVARDGKRIVGVASLGIYVKPLGSRGVVEDVVVHPEYRRRGIAEKMMRLIIGESKKRQLAKITLTSRAVHTGAHELYRKVGFKEKETTVFRMTLL